MPVCHVCDAEVRSIAHYRNVVAQITSDFRLQSWGGELGCCTSCGTVQKCVDDTWHNVVREIYATYDAFPLGLRAEQAVFANSSAAPRSRVLLDKVLAHLDAPHAGSLIDIGCGNGSLLRSFHQLRPGWRLTGADVTDLHRDAILAIDGVQEYFSGPPDQITGTYDLLVLSHVLEHVIDPMAFLAQIRRCIARGGALLIQVPDLQRSPFDLAVLDHASHFTLPVLAALVERAGYELLAAADDWVAKEITILACPSPSHSIRAGLPAGDSDLLAAAHLRWLAKVADAARATSSTSYKFGIFGTSIAGTWLFAELVRSKRVDLFLDEDPSRTGGQHFGRDIMLPRDTPRDATIYVALPPVSSQAVSSRLTALGIEHVVPPPFERLHPRP
jgi:SAM-dependent methyltransferase